MKKIFLHAFACIMTIGFTFKSNAQTGVTKLGSSALANNTANGNFNTGLGYYSLNSNTSGNKNTGSGANTLRSNTTGIFNTAIGYASLYHNTSASNNSAFGAYSLFSNTTGYQNTANGDESLYFNTTGTGNTAGGYRSLYNNTTASGNTANGHTSLFYNTTGYGNTANGYVSLKGNTAGYHNTASGNSSLISNTTGFENTAVGSFAMRDNTTGNLNTCSGYRSLNSNQTGRGNTANGHNSMYYNTTGFYSTANGYRSLYHNTTGRYNTADGFKSLYNNKTGTHNTALGYSSDVFTDALTNATAIGSYAVVDASNKVRIGNTAVTSIGGQVGWTIFSDGRYKKDIKENVQGLAFINRLRPITYTVNVKGLNEYFNKERKQATNSDLNEQDEASNAEVQKAEDGAGKIVYNGFIAQEVEEAAKKLNFEFSGVDRPENKDGLYGLRYDNFTVPLVKAVQELSGENEKLRSENENLASKYEALQKQIDELKAIIALVKLPSPQSTVNSHPSASLDQNIPNPFHNSTVINYTLMERYSFAKIVITDVGGKVLKEMKVFGSDKGSLRVDASTLAAGAYAYSLYVDGKLVDTKKMIATK